MKYPPKKQIKKKTEDLVRTIRNYVRGHTPAYTVKDELKCLFTDLVLEAQNEEQLENPHFPALLEEWEGK